MKYCFPANELHKTDLKYKNRGFTRLTGLIDIQLTAKSMVQGPEICLQL